jgi:hypothetical protein
MRDPEYRLRGLHRFPRGTGYNTLTTLIGEGIERPQLNGHVHVAVDATGPGRPVVDYLVDELHPTRVFAITITGGHEPSGTGRRLNIPKRDLIATTSLILEQHRLRIAENMRDTDELIEELLTYPRIISEHGTDTYTAPSGGHDDLVLALSLALWLAENRPIPNPDMWTCWVDRSNIAGIVTMGRASTTEPNIRHKPKGTAIDDTPPKSPHQPRSNYSREPARDQEVSAIQPPA